MDVSSQEKFADDMGKVATKKDSNQESNDNCAYDGKIIKNHEVSNGILNHEPEDVSSPRNTVSENPPKCSNLEKTEANQENKENQEKETKKLSRKKGKSRKKERVVTGSPRVLRSRSQEKPKIPAPVDAPAQETESNEKKRRKKKKIKEDQDDEFSKIRKHLKYLLSRISYEQNFIEAYAGEGWKGQSLEKLRPEKELERSKSNITRYKLKIRDLIQRIDNSFEEGKIPESLYDSEGLIDSEDIFCAKCGKMEVHLDNDIILCDGECERGFHQFCLDPPLLKEQVPPGDEGWLCPACDCKIDCFDLLNDSQGTDLAIGDNWEKVFPETVASGNNLNDASGLPSDDSEDDDYNPDGPEVKADSDGADADGADSEGADSDSSSDESDFSSASEDLGEVANKEQNLELPSDDSEDDDFNPDKVDSDEEGNKDKSSSSDFTSDSEDLGDLEKNEVQESLMSKKDEEIPKESLEDDSGPITAKRRVERLDYKKLHDEAYGNESSDSSDEDFLDTDAPKKQKNTKGAKNVDFNQQQKKSESTPVKRTNKKLDIKGNNSSPANAGPTAPGSSDTSSTKSPYKRLGEAATERLYIFFKENQYPDRNAKDNLAKELNLTRNQVSKWFENARWCFNHPGKRGDTVRNAIEKMESNDDKLTKNQQANGSSSTTPSKSRKRKGRDDESETHPSSSNRSARRSGRVQAKRL